MENQSITDQAADAAIEWFVRLRAEDVTEAERGKFIAWLREAREHQQAFVETLQQWDDLAIVKRMRFEELRPFPQIWDFKKKLEAGASS